MLKIGMFLLVVVNFPIYLDIVSKLIYTVTI